MQHGLGLVAVASGILAFAGAGEMINAYFAYQRAGAPDRRVAAFVHHAALGGLAIGVAIVLYLAAVVLSAL